jgi:hypothetical protein
MYNLQQIRVKTVKEQVQLNGFVDSPRCWPESCSTGYFFPCWHDFASSADISLNMILVEPSRKSR